MDPSGQSRKEQGGLRRDLSFTSVCRAPAVAQAFGTGEEKAWKVREGPSEAGDASLHREGIVA